MKKLIYILPLALTVTLFSCSNNENTEEETPKKEVEVKPLIERDEEVKDYFETLNDMIDEYINVADNILKAYEELESGDIDVLKAISVTQDLLTSWENIEELNHSLGQQEDMKSVIEKKLNAKDVMEFTTMYSETIARIDSLNQRIQDSNLQKYINME